MRFLFRFFKFLFYALLLSIVAGLPVLLWLMVEDTPRVSASDQLAVEDVEKVRRLLRDLDPRQLKDGETRRLTLTERDASLLVDQTLSRWPGAAQAKARVRFIPDHAEIQATLPLPNNPLGRYLNASVQLTLALYLSGKDPSRLLGEKYHAPTSIHPTLAGRRDLAQHFAISAALTGVADSHIANVIGIFKEVQDSQGGSGFSFADLTADRAGVRFAEQAIASATSARDVQRRVASLDVESAIMPSITALPEGLQDPEFRRRFERRDSAAYNVIKDEIERRLNQCDFYRPAS